GRRRTLAGDFTRPGGIAGLVRRRRGPRVGLYALAACRPGAALDGVCGDHRAGPARRRPRALRVATRPGTYRRWRSADAHARLRGFTGEDAVSRHPRSALGSGGGGARAAWLGQVRDAR